MVVVVRPLPSAILPSAVPDPTRLRPHCALLNSCCSCPAMVGSKQAQKRRMPRLHRMVADVEGIDFARAHLCSDYDKEPGDSCPVTGKHVQLELCSRLSESKRAADDRGHEGQPLDRLQHRLLLLHDHADHGWIRRHCGEASWGMCAERERVGACVLARRYHVSKALLVLAPCAASLGAAAGVAQSSKRVCSEFLTQEQCTPNLAGYFQQKRGGANVLHFSTTSGHRSVRCHHVTGSPLSFCMLFSSILFSSLS